MAGHATTWPACFPEMNMGFLAKAILLCFGAVPLWAQQGTAEADPCAGYVDSPNSPHTGPRKFNLISIAYSSAGSSVLIVDAAGRRFGRDSASKRVYTEIPHSLYEDQWLVETDSHLPASAKPEEMTIDFAPSGSYVIVVTSRKPAKQILFVVTSTCGKRWKKEISVPQSRKGVVYKFTLVYDSHAKAEPQLVEGDHTHGHRSR